MSSILQIRQPAFVEPLSVSLPNMRSGRGHGEGQQALCVEKIVDWSSEAQIAQLFTETGISLTVSRNSELFAEDQPIDNIYRVESGVIRTCKLLNDGRRQIDGFYMAGDIVGLEMGCRYTYCAEAIARSTVRAIRMRSLRVQVEAGGRMASVLWDMTARELQRSREHILLLGRRSATERVASFLLSFASHIGRPNAAEPGGMILDLPMSRQDMADYLGLTIETVSRTFTQLEGMGVIALLSARRVHLSNRTALRDLNG
ncbi:helix-turn-helix domain-containing protein [Pseudochelatococcus sp. G4_1912]|uniref:helix-turn-helix domain-containing protein n=1 Tax=Pseudochelatococcus sp. G4_1912 TaxID=3114288 RepID=UPI0039C67BD8